MPIHQIKKRNGDMVDFDRTRIEKAISLACDAIGHSDKTFIPVITDFIIKDIEHVFGDVFVNRIASVEDIQDIVERNLVKFNQFAIAKEYILYRARREEVREQEHEEYIKKFETQTLQVAKRNGDSEKFDIKKIKQTYDRIAHGYEEACPFHAIVEALKDSVVDHMATKDIGKLLIKIMIDMISVENIHWQVLAGRLIIIDLYKQAARNRHISIENIYSGENYKALFDSYIEEGKYYRDFYKYYSPEDIIKAGEYLSKTQDFEYVYTTSLMISKRYLLNPNKIIKELPQEMYMSVALFLAIPEPAERRLEMALAMYDACSSQKISLPTPTLLNARTNFHQLSSCFKINIDDDLRAIYHSVENMAQISKFGGGIGVYLGNIRSKGASIRGHKGVSGGVNPWIKVINDTAIAVNQLGARAGSISVTLDVWHRDIYDFLDLQTETGDIRRKAFDIFPSVSMPDLFMKRVEEDGDWTLFDPLEVTKLTGKKLQDHFGADFEALYTSLEKDTRLELSETVKAKDIFKKFLKTTVETGLPYVFYRDTVNAVNPNKHAGNIYSTQLCTEICQNTAPSKFIEEAIEDGNIVIRYTPGDTVVCNLASINVAKVHTQADIDHNFPIAAHILDNVITLNFYPIKESELTAKRYRSIGLGFLGLAEYLATHQLAYDSPEARAHVDELFEKYALATLQASNKIATERGTYELYEGSEWSKGILFGRDLEWYKANAKNPQAWEKLTNDIVMNGGLRFGYHLAPAPNTSTASVVGTTASLLPIYKKYFIETNAIAPTVTVAPNLNSENFWYYKEYINMDMNDVIDMFTVIYKWIDQSASFEWMVNPQKVSPKELYGYYVKAWKQGIKTVYYVRSLSAEVKDDCVSCSG